MTALEAAVGLYEAELKDLPDNVKLRIAHHGGQIMACYADSLMFRSPQPRRVRWRGDHRGEVAPGTAGTFDAVAKAIACARLLGADADKIFSMLRASSRTGVGEQ
jgi:hypothetical protein